ncbi:MAG: hypothetical protein ACWA47_00345 [Brevirhabdus sp.]
MTNKIAFFLALLIIGLFLLDFFVLHWNLPVFLGRKFMALTEWVAFWR